MHPPGKSGGDQPKGGLSEVPGKILVREHKITGQGPEIKGHTVRCVADHLDMLEPQNQLSQPKVKAQRQGKEQDVPNTPAKNRRSVFAIQQLPDENQHQQGGGKRNVCLINA